MRERKKKRNERSEDRRSPEGVRIIRADEAEEALDTGQAAGRRPEGELRFGDVPPAPEGPRSPHRFPLPDTVDPAAAVPRRPLAPPRRRTTNRPVGRRTARIDPDAAHDPRPWDERVPLPPGGDQAEDRLATLDQGEADATTVGAEEGPPATAPAASEMAPAWPGTYDEYPGGPGDQVTAEHEVHDPAAFLSPDYDPQVAYDAQVAYDPQVAHDVRVAYDPQGAYDAQVAYDPRAAYDPQGQYRPPAYDPPAYDPPAYDPPAGYVQPDYEQQAGYAQPAYDPAAGYGQPGSDPQPAYQPPGYDPDRGYEAPAWDPQAAYGQVSQPSVHDPEPAPASGFAEFSGQGQPPPGDPDLWPVAEHPLAEGPPAGDPPAEAEPVAVHPIDPTLTAAAAGPWSEGAAHREPEESVPGDETEWEPASQESEPASVPHDEGEQSMPASHGDTAGPGGSPDEPEAEEAPSLGLSVAPGSTELPHWTDPPTGEVPRMVTAGSEHESDDLKAWRALGSSATRWRGDGDWDEEVDLGDLGSEESRVGAMDTSLSEQSDIYSFDKEFDALEEERSGTHAALLAEDLEHFDDPEDPEGAPVAPEPVSVGASRPTRTASGGGPTRGNRSSSSRQAGGGGTGSGPGPTPASERDLGQAVAVGVGLVVLLFIAYAVGSAALLILATAVVVACAVEGYGMLQRAGFRPATLLGLVATAGVMFGAYWRGEAALPLIAVVMLVATMLWYLWQIVEARPLANVAVTTMTWLWTGLLGSYAALMLRASHGKGLFLGTIIPVIVADIVAYFVGRQVGHRPLAPHISPGKTVEGLLAGGLAAIIAAVIVGKEIAPWGGIKHGLALGIVVAVLAPVGDLFESMIKRDLSIKDSGTVLPGHGGLLDRFDAVLLVLPAAYYLATYLHIVH
jgi:phosphatidate cytidylyltransferase